MCEKIASDPNKTFDVVVVWNRDQAKALELAKKYLGLKRQQLISNTTELQLLLPAAVLVLDNLDDDLSVSQT